MKIAVISDVHGNKSALDATLEDIKEKNCEMLLCLGDLALAGYDPNYTVEKLKFLVSNESPIKTEIIAGNTDLMLLKYNDELFHRVLKVAPCMAYAMQEDLKILTAENLEFLKTLPINKELAIDNVKIFMCHGSPRRIDEGITSNLAPSAVEQMVEAAHADLIFCGHTHIPCGFQLESGKTVMNVGSIGRPMNDDKMPTYAILDTKNDESEYMVSHQMVKYDNLKVSELIRQRGFLDCDVLADMFIAKEQNG